MASEADCEAISGIFHPPRSSRAETASFAAANGTATVTGVDGDTLAAGTVASLAISDRVGSIPRRIVFADGSVFETEDNDAVDAWLRARHGRRFGLVHALERFHPRLVVVLVLIVAACVGLYRYALPVAVETAVLLTPPVAPRLMSRGVLSSLDETVFYPSELDKEKREAIASDFRAMAGHAPDGAGGFDLQFRGGGVIGPNAFALPDGTIVITDELVALVDDEDAIMGVLAHEIGHVVHEHSLRRLYRAAGVTAMIMFIGGDIGSGMEDLLVQGSGFVTLSYSRGQESEADRFSVELMAKAGRRPAGLARLFEVLRDEYGDTGGNDFLSTHPATVERIEEIRRHAAQVEER